MLLGASGSKEHVCVKAGTEGGLYVTWMKVIMFRKQEQHFIINSRRLPSRALDSGIGVNNLAA